MIIVSHNALSSPPASPPCMDATNFIASSARNTAIMEIILQLNYSKPQRSPSVTQDFETALCMLLSTAGKPLVRQKANEEFYKDGQANIEQMLKTLATLTTSPSMKVRLQLGKTLRLITEGRDRIRSNEPAVVQVGKRVVYK